MDARIEKAIGFMASDLDSDLTVAGIAGRVHMSPSRFAHLFAVELGVSPARALGKLRLKEGVKLLETSDIPIGEVAARLGMSESAFRRNFRDRVGVAPAKWRRVKTRA